jgi:thiol:disulfide interchange protein DsbD
MPSRHSSVIPWTVLPLVLLFAGAAAPAQPLGQEQRATVTKAVVNASGFRPGDKGMAAVVLDVKEGFHAQSRTPTQDYLIKFDVKPEENPAVTFGEVVYPPGKEETYPELGKLSVYTGRVVLYLPFEVKPDAKPGELKITGRLTYQICDDKSCYPPERPKFTIETKVVGAGEAVAPTDRELFKDAPAGDAPPKRTTATLFGRDLTQDAYVLAFFGAFVVGIIFNVMPCVLPVVPLKALGFYEVSQHNRAKSLLLGAVFSLGLIASFAVLGLFVVGLKGTQHQLNWGELFTKTWFRASIVSILVVMAVGTFGVFSVNLPTSIYRFTPRHDTYAGNFLFGVFTAALSTPCTFGMFVGLLTWALAQPSRVIGGALVTTVGVGMAFPYFLLSAFPEMARRFPRTGPWAELVKQMMGFLLLGTAVYFARPFIEKVVHSADNRNLAPDVFWWTLFGVVAAAGVFLIVRTAQYARGMRPRLVAAVVALLLVVPAFVVVHNLTYHPHQWVDYSDAALARAKSTGRPVLVEFTADWCGNCQALEAFVLNSRPAVEALKKHEVVMIKADVTNGNEPAIPLLSALNPAGAIPLTAIYSPHRDEPILLTGIYSTEDLQRAVETASRGEVARG